MENEVVKELIKAFKDAELTQLSLKCEAFELNLEKKHTPIIQTANLHEEAEGILASRLEVGHTQSNTESSHSESYIKAPMVGTFYSKPSKDDEPFVTVGSKVKKGDIVCIIEAMKLMNEVEAEQDGEIVEILISDEEMVEYNQPLFKIK